MKIKTKISHKRLFSRHELKLTNLILFIVISLGSVNVFSADGEDYVYTNSDPKLCNGFSVEFSFTGYNKNNQTLKNGVTLYPGQYSYTLRNSATGFSKTYNGAAPSQVSADGKTITLLGDNPQYSPAPLWCGWPNCSGGIFDKSYPVQILHGKTDIAYIDDFGIYAQVSSRSGFTELVNPCQILTANYVAPEPRSIPLENNSWPIPQWDVVSGMQRGGVPAHDYLEGDDPLGHTHAHLDIFVNGNKIIVPGGIGMVSPFQTNGSFNTVTELAGLHTHSASGILHSESDFAPYQIYTLGQLFDLWQIQFNQNQIGSYCTSDTGINCSPIPASHNLSVYVNGAPYLSELRQVPLNNGDEIAIVYGVDPAGGIPKCFKWPAGYVPPGTPGACP